MPPRSACAAALLAAAVLSSGCGARYVSSPRSAAVVNVSATAAATRHVVLVSVDGLRPDAIDVFNAPTLKSLIAEGSYSRAARTITPSKTLPSHTSMLTGLPPAQHGVLWNNVLSAKKEVVETPNIFSVARAHGYVTAAFFSKSKFNALQRAGTLDYSQAPGGWWGRWPSERTVADVERHLADARPNVLFIHLSDVDRAGHATGWMSPAYGRAVLTADGAIARIRAAADRAFGTGAYTLLVTADHGGHERNHGSADPRDVTIPWIAWGRGVAPGALDSVPIQTMDTAATVLWLLGVASPPDAAATPVTAAFRTRTPNPVILTN